MNEKAWLERYARALAKEQAAEQAEQRGAGGQRDAAGQRNAAGRRETDGRHDASAPGAGCSTLELIKQESMGGERRRMDSGAHDKGWQIAEVERLLGMPRRDIQRACYGGQGGVDLVHPKESSWGKRSYDARDLTRLFQVKRQRDAGRSLPEVQRVFEAAEAAPGGWETFEADQIARMREGAERAGAELAQADALRAATAGGGADEAAARLDAVIDGIFLQGVVGLWREAVAAGDAAAAARLDAVLAWFAAGSGPDGRLNEGVDAAPAGADGIASSPLGRLWAALDEARAQGAVPEEALPAAAWDAALGAAAPDPALMAALLEGPGMELALELRLGAGGYDYALRALQG